MQVNNCVTEVLFRFYVFSNLVNPESVHTLHSSHHSDFLDRTDFWVKFSEMISAVIIMFGTSVAQVFTLFFFLDIMVQLLLKSIFLLYLSIKKTVILFWYCNGGCSTGTNASCYICFQYICGMNMAWLLSVTVCMTWLEKHLETRRGRQKGECAELERWRQNQKKVN